MIECSEAYELVQYQANDEELWCEAQTESEAYLQRSLRELHDVIEKEEDKIK